jgi:hypothetical protein
MIFFDFFTELSRSHDKGHEFDQLIEFTKDVFF